MITFDQVTVFAILIWTFLYTVSYGKWTWQQKNKLGAAMIWIVAFSALILPLYTIYFRQ